MSEETINNPVASSKFESGKAHAVQAAEDLRAAAEAKAKELRAAAETKAHEFRGRAEEFYGQYRNRAQTFHGEAENYVRENPTKAVLSALGIGFLLGLIFRR
jgi:ElaB/YqjD/DUF883 family membrane-anchored ribosome-binding protein